MSGPPVPKSDPRLYKKNIRTDESTGRRRASGAHAVSAPPPCTGCRRRLRHAMVLSSIS
ncbi:protein of unknown function [Methylococcus capsulatus]|uniref:Uncharacterized protein n=1 Tax=Methylococcus capsulatus TaxID=414 RepID=A0AA35XZ89_METCP|nr:protein of unknown function [Methylococcus capsulatus]